LQVKKKKTFDKLVKTVSTPRRPTQDKNLPQSPNLKRLKTPILAKTAARTSLLSPKPENFRGLIFKKLLLDWEELSTRTIPILTSAVSKPKLDAPADNQPQMVLENLQE
jgi:hypothetical protein